MSRTNPFETATAYGLLAAVAARHGEREAIVLGDERVTFADFLTRVDTLAAGLTALGLGKGDSLAIWLPNRPGWFVAQYAAARLGIVVVALNPRYRAHELGYILGQSKATALLVTDHLGPIDYLETLHQVIPELATAVPGELASAALPHLRHVLVDAEDPYPGCHALGDLFVAGSASTDRNVGGLAEMGGGSGGSVDDVFTLLYTSGTTSFPKGAMISHRNCVPHGWNTGEQLRLTPEDRVLLAMPAAGTWGGLNIPLSTWSHGATLILMDVWDPLRALMLIEQERCTVLHAVDTMLKPMFEHPDFDRYDHSTLRTGGFASVGGGGPAMFDAVIKRLGVAQAFQPYGMTEVNALALFHDLDEPLELRAQPGIIPPPGLRSGSCTRTPGARAPRTKRASYSSAGPWSRAATSTSRRRRARPSRRTAGSAPGTSPRTTATATRSSRAGSRRHCASAISWSRRGRSRPISRLIPTSSRPSWSAYPIPR